MKDGIRHSGNPVVLPSRFVPIRTRYGFGSEDFGCETLLREINVNMNTPFRKRVMVRS